MIGKRIKELREQKGLTQGELAELIGNDGNTISRWERNKIGVGNKYIVKLAQALDAPVSYLMEMDTDDPRSAASKGEAGAEAKAPAEAQADANQIKLNFSTDMNEPSYKDFSTTTRGNLRYKFKDGSELEVPNTPEMAALFRDLVREIRQTQ